MDDLLMDYSINQSELASIEQQITNTVADLLIQQELLQQQSDKLREKIRQAMEDNEVKKYENDYLAITYIAPTTRTSVDSKLLKEKFADVYEQCKKTTDVKSSVRITIKRLPEIESGQKQEESLII